MVLSTLYSKTQLHITHDQGQLSGITNQSTGHTLRLSWLMTPVGFFTCCIQRVVTLLVGYFAFRFLFDQLDAEEVAATGPTNTHNSGKPRPVKANATGSDLVLVLWLAILWLRRKRQGDEQEEEGKLVERAVLRFLDAWKSSVWRSTRHQFCSCHVHCPIYSTASRPPLGSGYECSTRVLPAPLFLEDPRCHSPCQCPKCCERHYPSRSALYKAEISCGFRSALCYGETIPISLSAYDSEEQSEDFDNEKTLLKQESTNKGSSNGDPQSEGDETNSDVDRPVENGDGLLEDCWSTPSDEEDEREIWDVHDEQGEEFEQETSLKQTAKRSRKQKGKAKKALRLLRPGTFRKKIYWRFRDEEFLARY